MILRWYNGMKAMLEYYRDTRRLDERQSAWLRSVFDAIDKGATGSIDPKSLPMLFGAANVAPPPAFVARAKVRSTRVVTALQTTEFFADLGETQPMSLRELETWRAQYVHLKQKDFAIQIVIPALFPEYIAAVKEAGITLTGKHKAVKRITSWLSGIGQGDNKPSKLSLLLDEAGRSA